MASTVGGGLTGAAVGDGTETLCAGSSVHYRMTIAVRVRKAHRLIARVRLARVMGVLLRFVHRIRRLCTRNCSREISRSLKPPWNDITITSTEPEALHTASRYVTRGEPARRVSSSLAEALPEHSPSVHHRVHGAIAYSETVY